MSDTLKFRDYRLNTCFPKGAGSVDQMPSAPGVYAEIHRAVNYIRVGHSTNMRSRNKAAMTWAERHKTGTHTKASEIKRAANGNSEITEIVKRYGAEGMEFYVICDDPRLVDKTERQALENFMHEWCRKQSVYFDINREAAQKILKV